MFDEQNWTCTVSPEWQFYVFIKQIEQILVSSQPAPQNVDDNEILHKF